MSTEKEKRAFSVTMTDQRYNGKREDPSGLLAIILADNPPLLMTGQLLVDRHHTSQSYCFPMNYYYGQKCTYGLSVWQMFGKTHHITRGRKQL